MDDETALGLGVIFAAVMVAVGQKRPEEGANAAWMTGEISEVAGALARGLEDHPQAQGLVESFEEALSAAVKR